jgi:hypothetical protein
MAARKAPSPEEARFTVRRAYGNDQLVIDETTGWRWSRGAKTQMTRAKADEMAAKLGGIVCVDGRPVDKLDVARPARPKMPAGKAAGEREDPTAKIRAHLRAGEEREALRLAVKLRLGSDKTAIERAWEALQRPGFCRELGRDPEILLRDGLAALRRRFGGETT